MRERGQDRKKLDIRVSEETVSTLGQPSGHALCGLDLLSVTRMSAGDPFCMHHELWQRVWLTLQSLGRGCTKAAKRITVPEAVRVLQTIDCC